MGFNYSKINQLIDESGMPRKRFFHQVGITERKFEEWVAGAIPKEAILKRMANQLNVPISEFRETANEHNLSTENSCSKGSLTTKAEGFISNFIFLSEQYETLYFYADTAERLYLSGFYTECVTKLGILGESLVESILLSLGLHDYLDFKPCDRLELLLEEKHIPLKWYDVFNELRLARNDALHKHVRFNQNKALSFLRKAYDLTRWFGHETEMFIPTNPFVEPFKIENVFVEEKTENPMTTSDSLLDIAINNAEGQIKDYTEFLFTDLPEGLCVESYIGNKKIVNIPKDFQGKTIIEIGEQAFQNCSMIEVVNLPDSILAIRNNAFAWCDNLRKIYGSNHIKALGMRAFYKCSKLEEINITFTFIGKEAFAGCSSLKHYDFGAELVGIAGFAFAGCVSLKEFIANDGITVIGDHAFANCTSLSMVAVSDSVTSIGEEVFYNCNNIELFHCPLYEQSENDIASGLGSLTNKTHGTSSENMTRNALITPKKNSQHDSEKTLVEYLEYRGVEVIDKRNSGGRLWAVGTEETIGQIIDDVYNIFGVSGRFCSGSRSTGHRAGWFTASMSVEKRAIPLASFSVDYDEIIAAGKLYEKYFGKIDGLLILEDTSWTNEYCFVVDRISDDGERLEGVCYCKGLFQRYHSYPITRKFKLFNGKSLNTIGKIHLKYKQV